MAQNIGRLGVVLGIETAEFVKGLGGASMQITKFVDKAKPAILGVTAAMVALTAKTIAYADEITDVADSNNVAVSSVMALGTALAVSGGKAEAAGKMLSAFSTKVDYAAQGNEMAQRTFERLGISMADVANSTNEQLLDKVVNSLAKMKDPITRNALAMEAFSKAGKGIVWEQFVLQLEKGRIKYKQSEEGLIAMGEAADTLQIIMKGLMGEIAKGVGGDFKTLVDYLDKMASSVKGVGDVFRTVFETVVVLGSDIAFVFGRIAGVFDRFKLGIMNSGDEVKTFWKNYKEESAQARAELDAFQRKILDNSPSSDADAQGGGFYGKTGNENAGAQRIIEATNKNKEMLRVAKLLSDEYMQQEAIQLQQLALQEQMVGMTRDEAKEQQAVNAVIQSTQAQIDSINKKREDAAGRGGAPEVVAEYDRQIAKIYELQDVYIEMSRQVAATSIATQRTFAFGWDRAFAQYAEDAYNYASTAEEMFKSITGNMTAALDNFVENGKFSFSEFTSSIIKDLIKIQLRMQMMQLFSMGLNFAMGAFSSAGSTPLASQAASSGIISPFANGGEPPVGVPSLVGERGPELFIPQRAGTIIPNNQLSNVLGGGGTTFNGPYIASMNAIDTQSGVQFLAKNKMTIWSMNQSANRSIPAGR